MKDSTPCWAAIVAGVVGVLAGAQPAPPRGAEVRGTVASQSTPVPGARVRLEVYADEACVGLAKEPKLTPAQAATLKECVREHAAVPTDAKGAFRFGDLEPGWYKLLIEWDLAAKPASVMPVQWQGDWVISYYETRTGPKKYSALAQGKVRWLDAAENQRRDFDWMNSADPVS